MPVESYESLEEFEKIYKHFFNPLVNFINGYLSNRENSEEVVQNVFLRFWENKNQLNITGPVKSYLFQSAKNAMIDFTRRNKKYDHNESLVTGDHKNFLDLEESSLDPFIFRQSVEKVSKKFKPITHEIFHLYYFEGLNQEEIARHLKVSKRKVEYQMALALDILRDELKNMDTFFNK